MAARLNPAQDERTRSAIQTTQLVKRLQSFAFGEVEMSGDQVRAALGLIKKTMPDLQATSITGANNGPVVVRVTSYARNSDPA